MITPISASGLEALVGENGCERRAYNTYVNGVREDAGPGAQAGTLIHKMLEKYLVGSTDIDESITWEGYEIGATAKAMAEFLPPPRPDHNVEGNFTLEVEGVHFRGFIDLIDLPTFYDHKSTSGKRWAKTKKTLSTNIQFQMYARYIDENAVGQWTYGLTRFDPERDKKRAWAVSVKVEKQHIRDTFGEIVLKPAHRFLRMLEAKDINDLAPNFSSCHSYNKICPLHPSVGGNCHHPSTKDKFMSLLKNKKPLLEKLREEQTVADFVPACMEEYKKRGEEGDGINSPPMPTQSQIMAGSDDPAGARLVEDAPPVKRRGRPKKSVEDFKKQVDERQLSLPVEDVQTAVGTIDEIIPSRETLKEYEDMTESQQDSTAQGGEVDDYTDKSKPIYNLYISCLPLGNHDVTYAHDLIAKAAEAVCADMQLLHVKLAEFGKGGPMLSAQLKADLVEEPVHSLYLDGRSTESYDVRQTLMSLARNIIVGGV